MRSGRGCSLVWIGAALIAVLGAGQIASAQTLTYGPILGRGYRPDQMIVRWGTSNATDTSAIAYRRKGDTTWALQTTAATRDHEVILPCLATGETYEYEIRSIDTPSGATFTTCPLPGRPMDFIFYGDSRTGFGTVAGEHAKILIQVARKAPEMIFESGDIVPYGIYNQYLTEFFPVAKDLIKSTPFMAAPGNHDAIAGLPLNYGRIFPTPRPLGTPWKSYYAFNCGNALFLSLDSNIPTDAEQLQFIADQLRAGRENAAIDHVFVYLHHAPYSVGAHGDNVSIQNSWVPIFNRPENKVTAVFAGHDHIYARMDDKSGVFYIVTGGAGANLYSDNNTSSANKIFSKSTFNFVNVHLTGKLMSAIAYDDTGTEIDRFIVTKPADPPDAGSDVDGGIVDSGTEEICKYDAAGWMPEPPTPSEPGCDCRVAAGHASANSAMGIGLLLFFGCVLLPQRRTRRTAT